VTCSPARIDSEECRSESLRKRYLENIVVAGARPQRRATQWSLSFQKLNGRFIHRCMEFIKFLPPPVISPWSIESTLAELISSLY
jgi:hypothetical protein